MLFIAYCGDNKTHPHYEINLLSKNFKNNGWAVTI